uniref:Uncharacterized protein n=1 Tax=Avena sativa TaxID=4498 RepID=A0ACD5V8Y8_AVESA
MEWRPTQGSAEGDWRAQIQHGARGRIVDKIMETLKKHMSVIGPEELRALRGIAERFEEKMYNAATDQPNYLRMISLKMLSMDTKAQQAAGNAQVIPNRNNLGQGRIHSKLSVAHFINFSWMAILYCMKC